MKCHDACTPVVLWDGQSACNYSEAWRHECEARWILNLPVNKQNEVASIISAKRGVASLNRLEITVRLMREKRREQARSSSRSALATAQTRASTGARAPVARSESAGLHGHLF